MASAFARFNRRGGAAGGGELPQQRPQRGFQSKADERVGEILSDSNSELSSVDGDNGDAKSAAPAKQQPQASVRRSPQLSGSSEGSEDAERRRSSNSKMRAKRETSGGSNSSGAKIRQLPVPAKTSPVPVATAAATTSTIQTQSQSQSRAARGMKKTGSRKWYSDSENDEEDDEKDEKEDAKGKAQSSTKQAGKSLRANKSQQRKRDSEDDDEEVHSIEEDDSDLEPIATGRAKKEKRSSEPSPSQSSAAGGGSTKPKALRKLKTLRSPVNDTAASASAQVMSPSSESENTPRGTAGGLSLDPQAKKKTGFQKLVAKTFSPFSSRRKSIESPAIDTNSHTATNGAGDSGNSNRKKSSAAMLSPSSDVSASPASDARKRSAVDTPTVVPSSNSTRTGSALQSDPQQQAVAKSGKRQSMTADVISPLTSSRGSRGSRSNSVNTNSALAPEATAGPLINRRTSRLKQSPNGSELAGLPRSLGSPQDAGARRAYEAAAAAAAAAANSGGGPIPGSEALSPGQRKLAGAFLGTPGSGVVLEGWLRQKQRRGMKGMKKWNARYFVLYAKTNEVRYYADVVQSAWGPIPLGEIGSISLRLIQKIGKPSHPKYRGCRFDITCRNSWGTHYADDYVSLMADSPQTTVTWVNTLDSLLVRSANSPRPDASTVAAPGSAGASGGAGGSKLKRASSSKAGARQRRPSAMESESVVLVTAGDHVPKPVTFAIHYIFESTPGIETELFYQDEPDAAKLKTSLKFLNQFSTDPTRTPTLEELEAVLEPVTAGAVVKLWLKQLEQPVVPFEMFADFQALAKSARSAPFALKRDLRALIEALPKRNFAMLACVLSHLNDVNVYASENKMDAALLSSLFAEFILRPRRNSSPAAGDTSTAAATADAEREFSRALVEEMISNVDALIDESAVKELAEPTAS